MTGAPFSPALLPFDLTRGGQLFNFHAAANINQYAFYAQDGITPATFCSTSAFALTVTTAWFRKPARSRAPASLTTSRRRERFCGWPMRELSKRRSTRICCFRARPGSGGLAQNVFGSTAVPIQPGFRNQFNAGFQQAIGKFLLIDADYFWKYTHNAFDFSTLLNTTITFPIAWHNSKLDGVTGRVSTTNLKGFQAYWTFGHTRARYFPAGGRRADSAGHAAGRRRVPHRSRSGVSVDSELALPAAEERGVDRADLSLRQRTGGERRARCGRGAGAYAQSAGHDRPGLQRSIRHGGEPAHELRRPGRRDRAWSRRSCSRCRKAAMVRFRARRMTITIPTA